IDQGVGSTTIATQRRFLAQQRAAEIRSRPPTRTQLRNQMMTYLKHVGGKKHSDLKTKNFEEIQVLYEKDWNVVSWKLHGSSGVNTLMSKARLVIHMLVEKKYHLRKKVLLKMLELKLESEEDSTMALELIRFVKKLVAELEPENSDRDEKDL
ncbi:hypothetical protein Tco_1269263, partial [Tanacetum coccineum]